VAATAGHPDQYGPIGAPDEHAERAARLRPRRRRRRCSALFPFQVDEVRDSGAGGGVYTVKGHAAVFNQWSLDLGGFRERIKPGAFDDVLSTRPARPARHGTTTRARLLSSTRSKDYPLELHTDDQSLHYRFFSKVAPTSYAKDLQILLTRGDIDQSSFAFTVDEDEWRMVEENGEQVVERDVRKVAGLFDVTTCAMGAYPQTHSRSRSGASRAGPAAAAHLHHRFPGHAHESETHRRRSAGWLPSHPQGWASAPPRAARQPRRWLLPTERHRTAEAGSLSRRADRTRTSTERKAMIEHDQSLLDEAKQKHAESVARLDEINARIAALPDDAPTDEVEFLRASFEKETAKAKRWAEHAERTEITMSARQALRPQNSDDRNGEAGSSTRACR
jgi:HK97 family phage prohead protease